LSTEVEQKEKDRIEWRRDKVQQLSSQGYNQREIAQILQVSNGTVNKDLSVLIHQAKHNIKRYIDERLPEEYEKCLVGLTTILREAIRFVSSNKLKGNQKSYSSNEDDKESKETGEIITATITTNEVF
jgi:hypothetical protein